MALSLNKIYSLFSDVTSLDITREELQPRRLNRNHNNSNFHALTERRYFNGRRLILRQRSERLMNGKNRVLFDDFSSDITFSHITRSISSVPPSRIFLSAPTHFALDPESAPNAVTVVSKEEHLKLILEAKTVITEELRNLDGKDEGGSWPLYAEAQKKSVIENAVQSLISLGQDPKAAEKSLTLGQGTWEVFYAPHLSRLSQPIGVRFNPIRYTLNKSTISSNVKYTVPILGEGWLSASGQFSANGTIKVNVLFDSFWVDQDPRLRPVFSGQTTLVDRIINNIGRALFFPDFSVFPVLYVDEDVTVFQFTPLKTNIAARRVAANTVE